MATMIMRSAPPESLRPVTSVFVETLDILLDELAAKHGDRDGTWLDVLQEKVVAAIATIKIPPREADAAQVAQSAIRDRFSELRLQLNSVAIASLLSETSQTTTAPV